MFGKILLFLATVSLTACAQPKYENVIKESNPGNGSTSEKVSQCQVKFKNSQYCLTWVWEVEPTDSVAGSLVFKISRGNNFDDSPVLTDFDFPVSVLLWMPSMGHGSSPTKTEKLDVGTYRTSNVFFVMPGDWEIRFQVKDGKTITDEAIVSLSI